jgi:hypothetical protein
VIVAFTFTNRAQSDPGIPFAQILDSIIAAVMIYELHHSKSAFQGTKSVVETMSRILVANGFLLTVYQLAIALAYAFGTVSNSSGFTIVANDLIGKIYAITSLLASASAHECPEPP